MLGDALIGAAVALALFLPCWGIAWLISRIR